MPKAIAVTVQRPVDEQADEHFVILLKEDAIPVLESFLEGAHLLEEAEFVLAYSRDLSELLLTKNIYDINDFEDSLGAKSEEPWAALITELPHTLPKPLPENLTGLNLGAYQDGSGLLEAYTMHDAPYKSDFFDQEDLAALKEGPDHG